MTAIYHTLLADPLTNALVVLYNTIAGEDLGIAIILLTILIRILLFPLFQKGIRYQAAMQALQPKMKKIQEEHKHNLEARSQATMALYKEHQINPFSGFVIILLQIPILIALYQIILHTLTPGSVVGLYSFVRAPEMFQTMLFGLINLKDSSILIVILAAGAQYIQGILALPRRTENQTASKEEVRMRRMVLIGPIVTIVIFMSLPAAIGLYWLTTSLFSILQQVIINKQLSHGQLEHLHNKPHSTPRI